MRLSYRLLSVAHEEVAESIAFYNDISDSLGRAFFEKIETAIETLRKFPAIGTPVEYDFRSFPLRGFPFSLVYKIGHDEIIIIAVAHQSRDPQYWHDRTVG